jgi:hypothetical protein
MKLQRCWCVERRMEEEKCGRGFAVRVCTSSVDGGRTSGPKPIKSGEREGEREAVGLQLGTACQRKIGSGLAPRLASLFRRLQLPTCVVVPRLMDGSLQPSRFVASVTHVQVKTTLSPVDSRCDDEI